MADGNAAEAEDWDAVATAISARLTDTRTTQMDVAARARVSLTTLRELQHNLNPRRRRPQTLAAISEALGWPAGYLVQVLHGIVRSLTLTRRPTRSCAWSTSWRTSSAAFGPASRRSSNS